MKYFYKGVCVKFLFVFLFSSLFALIFTSSVLAEQAKDEKKKNPSVTMTLESALQLAIVRNLRIQEQIYDIDIAEYERQEARGPFDVMLAASFGYTDESKEPTIIFLPTRTEQYNYGVGLNKEFITGTNIGAEFSTLRSEDDSTFTTVNPAVETALTFTLRQALLKNFFGIVSRNNLAQADTASQVRKLSAIQEVEKTIVDVVAAYWLVVGTNERLKAAEEALGRAETFYSLTKRKARKGTAEKRDVLQAQALLLLQQDQVLLAKEQLASTQRGLARALSLDQSVPIVPIYSLDLETYHPDVKEALDIAMVNRSDLASSRLSLEQARSDLKAARNELLPQLDAVGRFASNGLDQELGPSSKEGFSFDFPTFFGGVELSYPIGDRAGRARYKKSQVEVDKFKNQLAANEQRAELEIRDQVNRVILDSERLSKAREIEDAERNKFENEKRNYLYGRSDTKVLIDFNDDFTDAQLRKANAVVEYATSLAELERRQGTILEKFSVKVKR